MEKALRPIPEVEPAFTPIPLGLVDETPVPVVVAVDTIALPPEPPAVALMANPPSASCCDVYGMAIST